jgi:hypothetical protein
MFLPSGSALVACLAVLERACARARNLGCEAEKRGISPERAAELTALMDAVHNLPFLLQNWERCNEDLLRGTLFDFDQRFPHSTGSLVALYDWHRNRVA